MSLKKNIYRDFKIKYRDIRFKNKKINNNLVDYDETLKSVNLITLKGLKKRYLWYFMYIKFKYSGNNFFNIFINKIYKNSFFFYIHFIKVHKNIRKFSRGKSGKYRAVYKYVPIFKRLKTTLKIFFREVRIKKVNKYFDSLLSCLFNFVFKRNKSLINFIKNNTYKKLYKKYKYSILLK